MMLVNAHQTLIAKTQDIERQSFLVTTWSEGEKKELRICVQNIHTGERRTFYTLKQYISFLSAR